MHQVAGLSMSYLIVYITLTKHLIDQPFGELNMIYFINNPSLPAFFAGVLTILMTGFLVVVFTLACFIVARLLQEGYAWITDGKASCTNIIETLFANKFNSVFNKRTTGDWRFYYLLMYVAFSIILYELALVCSIVFTIMYLSRFTVRLKTALTKHIGDKKAHK